MMLAQAQSKLTAVVVFVIVDVPDDLLQRDRAEDFALPLAQAGGRIVDAPEIGDGLAGERRLDERPGRFQPGHQFGGGAHRLPLAIPVRQ